MASRKPERSKVSDLAKKQPHRAVRIGILCWGVLWASYPALTWGIQGAGYAQKVLTHMVTPWFACWSLLVVGCVIAIATRRWVKGSLLAVVVLVLWFVSTPITSDWMVRQMETRITPWDSEKDPPLDTIVVFGGGTSRDDHGRSQQDQAGDRVGWGARLFLMGKTRKLIATGAAMHKSLPAARERLDPSWQTREIWNQLGIPDNSIEVIGGENTFQEIQNLKMHPDVVANKRIGLLTSALHLPRVMRLAQHAGIQGIPIAADYRSRRRTFNAIDFLPSANELNKFDLLWKEWLAQWVGR